VAEVNNLARTRGSRNHSADRAPDDGSNWMSAVGIDGVDSRIIDLLRTDGRMSNRDLAAAVGVNEATIRARLRRLDESNTIRVVAIRDLRAMGFDHIVAVGVQVKGRLAEEVARDLAKLSQVLTANVTIGANDIELQVVAKDLKDISDLLTNVLPGVPGVARLSPGLALKVFKYQSTWAPLG
jgi:Lrp/AsnC family transcriptional regulator, regulator for asnA, asnC and gidA